MIHQAKSNPQLLDEQIFSERIASAISAIGTFATCRRTPTMSVDGERPEVNGRRCAFDPKATSRALKALRTRPNRRMKMANAPALIGLRDQHGEARWRLDDASVLGL